MNSIVNGADGATPILLLKTKSIPNDGYEDQFSTKENGVFFEPAFVPVLEHTYLEEGLDIVRNLLLKNQIGKVASSKYGGLIFTSQRAVEAFARLVEEGTGARLLPVLDFNNI
jgi:uroporphyrinogen-III synthase